MSVNHKYKKNSNSNMAKNLNKNLLLLNNMSTDFSKTTKLLNNNYLNQKNINTNSNIKNNNNNNYIYDKKIFQNTKLYNVAKPTKYIKKRNFSNSSLKNPNNLIASALTEDNLNNKPKKFCSIFHSKTLKLNNRNINIQKNQNIDNNTNKNKINLNNILHNSNSFKLMTKSKSNMGFIKQPQYKNLIINTQDKNTNGGGKIFSTIGQINNLRIKNIKYNSGNKKKSKKIINTNVNANNISNNNYNKLSDSIPKKSGDNSEKINNLEKEIENYKKEINNKEDIIKKQIIRINKLNNNLEKSQNNVKIIQKKYNELEQEYNIMKNNYLLCKDKINEYENNIKTMKQKEIKLMQVLYLVKERGIDINSILAEVNQITFHELTSSLPSNNIKKENENNEENKENSNSQKKEIKGINDNNDINEKNENYNNDNNNINNNLNNNNNQIESNSNNNYESERSDLTVYFQDKVKMNNIMETKTGQNIPKLNFGYLPEYSSDSDSQQNINNIYNNTLMEEENLYYPKFTKFQNSA